MSAIQTPDTGDTALALPLIDISPYLTAGNTGNDASPISQALDRCTADIRSALETHGFFYLKGHGISQATLDAVLEHARAFFQTAPEEEKCRIKRDEAGVGISDGARGYQRMGENVTMGLRDWQEALDWYREMGASEGATADDLCLDASGLPTPKPTSRRVNEENRRPVPYPFLEGINLWPSTPPTFRDVYEDYVRQMRRLGSTMLGAVGRALELEDPDVFVKATADSFWSMRAIGYPPLSAEADAETGGSGISCGEHSDYGCLTLLLTDPTRGALQVRDRRRDGAWLHVDPVPGAFVVNVGDMVELWTAGLVPSTKHRVIHRAANYRVSVPFFFEPARHVRVQPLPECVARMKALGRTPLDGDLTYWNHLVGKIHNNFTPPSTELAPPPPKPEAESKPEPEPRLDQPRQTALSLVASSKVDAKHLLNLRLV